jgi:hypothetical protein
MGFYARNLAPFATLCAPGQTCPCGHKQSCRKRGLPTYRRAPGSGAGIRSRNNAWQVLHSHTFPLDHSRSRQHKPGKQASPMPTRQANQARAQHTDLAGLGSTAPPAITYARNLPASRALNRPDEAGLRRSRMRLKLLSSDSCPCCITQRFALACLCALKA